MNNKIVELCGILAGLGLFLSGCLVGETDEGELTSELATEPEVNLRVDESEDTELLELSHQASQAAARAELGAEAVTPGDFDASFGSGGLALYSVTSFNNLTSDSMVLQADGKIVGSGTLKDSNGCYVFVARYNSDGSPDGTFAGGSGISITQISVNSNCYSAHVDLQSSGKLVVAATRDDSSSSDFVLLRYHANGSLDSTFGVGGMVVHNYVLHDQARDVVVQPDDKILLAGFSSNNNNTDFVIVRFTSSGYVDTSFGFSGRAILDFNNGSNDNLSEIALQPNGKILAVGYTFSSSAPDFALARFHSSGSRDYSFGSSGRQILDIFGSTDIAHAIAVQSDGRILVAGDAYHSSLSRYYMTILRLNSNATAFDSSFGNSGATYVSFGPTWNVISDVALQSDGKIVAAGYTDARNANYDVALLRYNSNGSLDSAFLGDGGFSFDVPTNSHDLGKSLAIQNDGKILVGGDSSDRIMFTRHWN